MTDAIKSSEASFSDQRKHLSHRAGRIQQTEKPFPTRSPHARETSCPPSDCGGTVAPSPGSAVPARGELDRLYNSLSAVTPENHPRTAKLLASSTRKMAQKVIEEAGEVALAAVKHNARATVQESADLLYHLVALWHRASIDPDQVWTEMRCRADALGIAEKLPKLRHQQLASSADTAEFETKTEGDGL